MKNNVTGTMFFFNSDLLYCCKQISSTSKNTFLNTLRISKKHFINALTNHKFYKKYAKFSFLSAKEEKK